MAVLTKNNTFGSRKHTVFKKSKELSVLCDVDVSVIVYPPRDDSDSDSNSNSFPHVWSSKPIHQILDKFFTVSSKNNNNKAAGFDEFFRAGNSNWSSELGTDELNKLVGDLEGKIQLVTDRINFIKHKPSYPPSSSSVGCNNNGGNYCEVESNYTLDDYAQTHLLNNLDDSPPFHTIYNNNNNNNKSCNSEVSNHLSDDFFDGLDFVGDVASSANHNHYNNNNNNQGQVQLGVLAGNTSDLMEVVETSCISVDDLLNSGVDDDAANAWGSRQQVDDHQLLTVENFDDSFTLADFGLAGTDLDELLQ